MNTPNLRNARRRATVVAAIVGGVFAPGTTANAQNQQVSTQMPPVSYAYVMGSDTLGTESLSISPDQWRGMLVMRGQPRVEWQQQMQGVKLATLVMRMYSPNASETDAPAQTATFLRNARGDSMVAEIATGANRQRQAFPASADAVPLINASLLHAVTVAQSFLEQGRNSFDVVTTAGAQPLSGTVRRSGDTLAITLMQISATALLDARGVVQEVSVPAQGLRLVRLGASARSSGGEARPAERYSYDAPASAPYTAEHVRIPTGRGYELAATYTRPNVSRPVGVVITISGSGPQDRDERIAAVPGYAPFREIADTLARRGVATLRFDDRGAGESGGAHTLSTATTVDFADDVRSIIEWLRKRPDVDASRIVLAGHSEGGIIAPMIATTDKQLRAIAVLAGPAYTGRRILMYQNEQAIRQMTGATEHQRDSILATVPARIDELGKSSNWIGFFIHHDPLPVAQKVKQPVLVLHGETDRQVTVEQADSLAAAFRSGGNSDVTLRTFPATNHLFVPDPSGLPQGYTQLKDVRVRKEVLGTLADWVERVMR